MSMSDFFFLPLQIPVNMTQLPQLLFFVKRETIDFQQAPFVPSVGECLIRRDLFWVDVTLKSSVQ